MKPKNPSTFRTTQIKMLGFGLLALFSLIVGFQDRKMLICVPVFTGLAFWVYWVWRSFKINISEEGVNICSFYGSKTISFKDMTHMYVSYPFPGWQIWGIESLLIEFNSVNDLDKISINLFGQKIRVWGGVWNKGFVGWWGNVAIIPDLSPDKFKQISGLITVKTGIKVETDRFVYQNNKSGGVLPTDYWNYLKYGLVFILILLIFLALVIKSG
jgi:hypothetical protein